MALLVKSQYSSRVSPLKANTGMPAAAIAAAAWSWVEKMLQLCPPHVRAQFDQGFDEHRRLDGHVQGAHDPRAGQRLRGAVFLLVAIRPGISFSAIAISLRPKSARLMSFT